MANDKYDPFMAAGSSVPAQVKISQTEDGYPSWLAKVAAAGGEPPEVKCEDDAADEEADNIAIAESLVHDGVSQHIRRLAWIEARDIVNTSDIFDSRTGEGYKLVVALAGKIMLAAEIRRHALKIRSGM